MHLMQSISHGETFPGKKGSIEKCIRQRNIALYKCKVLHKYALGITVYLDSENISRFMAQNKNLSSFC